MKGKSNMNNFRERILSFLDYIKKYNVILTVLIFLICVNLLPLILPYDIFIAILGISIFSLPIILVHLIKEPSLINFNCVDEKKSSKNLKNILSKRVNVSWFLSKTFSRDNLISFFKNNMVLYVKAYILLILNCSLAFTLLWISYYGLMAFSFESLGKNLGSFIVFFLLTYIMFQGVSFFLNTLIALVYLVYKKFSIPKSIYMSLKFARKFIIKHIINVSLFGFFIMPIIMISDTISNITYPSNVLRGIYILLIITYAIFDIKDKIISFNETANKSYFKNKKSKV